MRGLDPSCRSDQAAQEEFKKLLENVAAACVKLNKSVKHTGMIS